MVVVADGNEKFKDLFIEEANEPLTTIFKLFAVVSSPAAFAARRSLTSRP
jgi:hypothetical protein